MKQGHATSGTVERAAHPLSGQGLVFRLADEMQGLRSDIARTSGGRAAKTLAKADGLRVTLTHLQAGVRMDPRAVAGGASLQVLEGRLSVHADGRVVEAGPGDLVLLGENLREPVRAEEDAFFLVTVAWPEGAGAWEHEAMAGRL
jgi:ethanolamine utilization protein EutQ (cupin superfamily)